MGSKVEVNRTQGCSLISFEHHATSTKRVVSRRKDRKYFRTKHKILKIFSDSVLYSYLYSMKKINYKSDFDFILPFPVCMTSQDGTCERKDLGWPDFDWEARFWTWSKANVFIASRKGDKLTNCFNDNGRIHIVCSNHGLRKGLLKVELHSMQPDVMFSDAVRDVFNHYDLDIELVREDDCCGCAGELSVITPGKTDDTTAPSETVEGEAFTFEEIDDLIDSVGSKYTPKEEGEDSSIL